MPHSLDTIAKIIVLSVSQVVPDQDLALKLKIPNERVALEVNIVFQEDVMLDLH